jgi:hypothetical protein
VVEGRTLFPWISKLDNYALTRTLLRHGFFWISFSILFDYLTSWIMMSMKGASAEGNATARTFFEQRTLAAFLTLVESQWYWIIFISMGGIAYFAWTNSRVFRLIASRGFEIRLTLMFTWVTALFRLVMGPSTNVAAIIDRSIYSVIIFSILFATVIAGDFF